VGIALRALSSAVNDQATGVQVIDAIDSLLAALATRDLDVGDVTADDGALRVKLVLPAWDEYLALAVDEITLCASNIPSVIARIDRLLEDLQADAPQALHLALERRRRALPASTRTP
jgi:uncharacterized membrane protein